MRNPFVIIYFLFIGHLIPIYGQEEYIFVGYDLRESFSPMCNEQSTSYGILLLRKYDEVSDLIKSIEKQVKPLAKYVPITKKLISVENEVIVGVIETTTYCVSKKIDYKSIKFISANSREELNLKMEKNELLYRSQKLRNRLLEIITIDTFKEKFKNKDEPLVIYKKS